MKRCAVLGWIFAGIIAMRNRETAAQASGRFWRPEYQGGELKHHMLSISAGYGVSSAGEMRLCDVFEANLSPITAFVKFTDR